MRLTLRTLLAYLDDTLPASEIKTIGEKVSESSAAKDLIDRIKQVTRRRRLTAPPSTGPGAFEPNDVSEYLDNELDSETIAEVERLCLESDVHLAEVAACHQILTLILGDPPLVPPKAKERMYALVKGRESVPNRKAAPVRKPSEENREEDLGLSGAWVAFVLPAAAVLLIAALGLAVWSFSGIDNKPRANARNDKPVRANDEKDQEPEKDKQPEKDKDHKANNGATGADKDKDKDKGAAPPEDPNKDKAKPKDGSTDKVEPETPKGTVSKIPEATKDRAEMGICRPGGDVLGVLLARQGEKVHPENWVKILPARDKASVYSSDTLMALPGFSQVVRTPKGIELHLRGMIPEFAIAEEQLGLLESAVVLHTSKDVDLDLTLVRGRIYVTNFKENGPAKVRLRFGDKQVWDITLNDPQGEFGAEMVRFYTPLLNPAEEEPLAVMRLGLISGEAVVNMNRFDEYTGTGRKAQVVQFGWTSASGPSGPQRTENNGYWEKQPPQAQMREGQSGVVKAMNAALDGLGGRLKTKSPLNSLKESVDEKNDIVMRLVGIYGMGAIDDISNLVDALGDENPNHFIDRDKAHFTLRNWVARGKSQYAALYDDNTDSGLLRPKLKRGDAKTVREFLFALQPAEWEKPETYELLAQKLQSNSVAVAHLAFYHLFFASRGLVKLQPFNAAASLEDRKKYSESILDMVDKKLLPPKPQPQPKDKGKN